MIDSPVSGGLPLSDRRIGLLTAWASRANGGVFEAVVRQAELVTALGGQPVVIALNDGFAAADRFRFGGAEVHHVDVAGPRRIGYAPRLLATLLTAKLDLLHLHGIWMYPSAAGARWAKRTGRPYLVSPHGMLDPWITARGRGKKALARLGYERRSWAAAAMLHALTTDEAADIVRETGRRDIAVIPNAAPAVLRPAQERRGMLYLGRIHPKKNLAALIDAWRMAACSNVLTIAGWGDDADVADLIERVAAAAPTVRFVGAVDSVARDRLIGEARWLVLPSLSEGLPMVVLEAWAAGTPTIMTPACHLPEGFAAGAALPCRDTADAIAAPLRQANDMQEAEWQRRSAAAQALAAGPFSPGTVAGRWSQVYEGMLLHDAP